MRDIAHFVEMRWGGSVECQGEAFLFFNDLATPRESNGQNFKTLSIRTAAGLEPKVGPWIYQHFQPSKNILCTCSSFC